MRSYFLAKTEPTEYSIDHLRKDLRTFWDGIKNAQALKNLRMMRPGDRLFLYHSGGESAIRGMAEVNGMPEPDPRQPNLYRIEIAFLRAIDPPATLAEIKASRLFDSWALVRQPRLSLMPAPVEFVQWMRNRYEGVDI